MGFSLKRIVKKVGKAVTKVAKVVKKAAPIAMALTGVGGVVGAVASKAVGAIKNAKAMGVKVQSNAVRNIVPLGQAVAATKAIKGVKTAAKKAAAEKAAPAAKKKAAPKPLLPKKAPKTKLKPLWDNWQSGGGEGFLDWETYADSELNG